jgi:hypothetical protein
VGFWAVFPGAAGASPLDGNWEVRFPCNGEATMCQGRYDLFTLDLWVFTLDLWSNGAHLCGSHIASANLGYKVDESDVRPSIAGTVSGNRAMLSFKSSWGGSGRATIEAKDGRLYWHTTDHEGEAYIPHDAILDRKGASSDRRKDCP